MASARPLAAPAPALAPRPRRRARALVSVSALAGGLAGLAAGAACMAWVPPVGRDVGAPAGIGAAPSIDIGDRSFEPAPVAVARVLTPAARAGVVPVRDAQEEDRRP